MAVFLSILKIIGIVLLAVIALALIIILVVLLVPFRYRIRADKSQPDADLSIAVKVTFLLHLLSGGFTYENNETDKYGRILGIKVWPRNKDTDREDDTAADNDTATDHDTEAGHAAGTDETDHGAVQSGSDDLPEPESTTGDIPVQTSSDKPETDEKTQTIEDRIVSFVEKLLSKKDAFDDKISRIQKEIRFWDKMVHDERNQNAVGFARDVIVRFLKKIAPRSVKGFVHFGFDDPATTGKILSYLALIYPALPKKMSIDPSFEDTLIYGKADIKGGIALIHVAVSLLKLYFNKDCKRMYRIYKRHKADKS